VNYKKLIIFIFILLEIISSTLIFFIFRIFLKKYPNFFPNDLLVGVAIYIGILFFLNLLVLGAFTLLNKKMTKEQFNYHTSINYLIIGIAISLVFLFIVNVILKPNFTSTTEFIIVLISYLFPLLLFNYGLRKR